MLHIWHPLPLGGGSAALSPPCVAVSCPCLQAKRDVPWSHKNISPGAAKCYQFPLPEMAKMQSLKAFLNERLTAAAEEIFGAVEKTIAEYKEEICRSKDLEINRLRMQLKLLKSGWFDLCMRCWTLACKQDKLVCFSFFIRLYKI